MTSLIEILNKNIDKSSDEIVEVLSDPICKPITLHDLGVERLRTLQGVYVHFLRLRDDGSFEDDSPRSGECFQIDSVYESWCDRSYAAGGEWHLVSHAAFPTVGNIYGSDT